LLPAAASVGVNLYHPSLNVFPSRIFGNVLLSCFSFSFALLYAYLVYKRGARKMGKQGCVSVRSFQGRLPGQLCWIFSP